MIYVHPAPRPLFKNPGLSGTDALALGLGIETNGAAVHRIRSGIHELGLHAERRQPVLILPASLAAQHRLLPSGGVKSDWAHCSRHEAFRPLPAPHAPLESGHAILQDQERTEN